MIRRASPEEVREAWRSNTELQQLQIEQLYADRTLLLDIRYLALQLIRHDKALDIRYGMSNCRELQELEHGITAFDKEDAGN